MLHLVSLRLRLKDLLGPETRVKKKKKMKKKKKTLLHRGEQRGPSVHFLLLRV